MELQPLSANNPQKDAQNGNGAPKPFIPSSQGLLPGRYRASRFGTYRPTNYDKFIIVAVILLDILLFLLAGGAFFAGIYLNVRRGSYADLCSDNEWFGAAAALLAVASLILIFLVISFFGIYLKSSRLTMIFIFFLVFLICGELTAGIYAFARRSYIEDRFSACMQDAYQHQYKDDAYPHVTKAWDLFQDRFDCCGVNDPLDYQGNNKIASSPPKACGGTLVDAHARQPCLEVLKRRVLDNFFIIGGSAIGIAVIQIFAVVCNVFLVRSFYRREDYE